MGFEPTTHCWASDFESDRWPIRLPSESAGPKVYRQSASRARCHVWRVETARFAATSVPTTATGIATAVQAIIGATTLPWTSVRR